MPTLKPDGARYQRLADAIAAAVECGELPPGEKLPPQRVLAHALSVTVGTITRAYALAQRRGYVDARVGSGTYVRRRAPPAAAFRQVASNPRPSAVVDLSLSLPPPCAERAAGLQRAMAAVQADATALAQAIAYQPESGLAYHREWFADWMQGLGLPVAATDLIVTQGGMHGIYLALSALLEPGGRVAAETLSYPGLISAAQQQRIRLVAVAHDENGVDVAAVARRHEQQPFAALYVMPEHHNPTTARLAEDRRAALAALARKRDFWLIEDSVMPIAAGERGTALFQLAPERTVHVFSLSKMLGGGLRLGVMCVPGRLRTRVEAAIRAQSWMPPPLMASLGCEWIRNGDAQRLLAWQEDELSARQALAARRLRGIEYVARPAGFFLWLRLAAGLRAAPVVDQLAEQGVRVTSAEAFCVGSEPAPQAIRVCLSAAADREQLARALDCIRETVTAPAPAPWRTL